MRGAILLLLPSPFLWTLDRSVIDNSKPSQGVNWGARKSTSPCLLAIPAFDRIAGLCNRHLWSHAEGLDWVCERLVPMWRKLIMGGINFGWLAVWVPSPDWLRRKSDFCQPLRWCRRAWWGECGPCLDWPLYTLAFALQLRKITENFSQVSRKVLGS
jgi:hypothetical protein